MNFLLRTIPKSIVKSVARLEAKRVSFLKNSSKKVSSWWYYNGSDFIERAAFVLLIVVVAGLIIGVFCWVASSNNTKLLQTAHQHIYQKNEDAYCNHGQDDSNAGSDAGWLPCTVIQKNNAEGTEYFVSYGTVQANISVDEMKQR